VQRAIGRNADDNIGIGRIRRQNVSAKHILFRTANYADTPLRGEPRDHVVSRINTGRDDDFIERFRSS
jgi:hypothetical protein